MPNNEVEAPTLKPCPFCGEEAQELGMLGKSLVRHYPHTDWMTPEAWNTRTDTLPARPDVAELREKLAALCSLIPESYAIRWRRQMATPYSELSDAEKDSDRKEADKFIALLSEHLCASSGAGELISRAEALEIVEPWLPSDIAAELRALPTIQPAAEIPSCVTCGASGVQLLNANSVGYGIPPIWKCGKCISVEKVDELK